MPDGRRVAPRPGYRSKTTVRVVSGDRTVPEVEPCQETDRIRSPRRRKGRGFQQDFSSSTVLADGAFTQGFDDVPRSSPQKFHDHESLKTLLLEAKYAPRKEFYSSTGYEQEQHEQKEWDGGRKRAAKYSSSDDCWKEILKRFEEKDVNSSGADLEDWEINWLRKQTLEVFEECVSPDRRGEEFEARSRFGPVEKEAWDIGAWREFVNVKFMEKVVE